MQTLKVGFLSSQNYFDRTAWSGTMYLMYRSLASRDEIDVVCLGRPFRPNRARNTFARWRKRLRARGRPGTAGDEKLGRTFAARVRRQLGYDPCDVLFAPVASWELNYVRPDIPVVYLSDTTAKLRQEHYGRFEATRSPREVELIARREARAIANSDRLVYPSLWAADSADRDYMARRDTIDVIPFGANLTEVPTAETVLASSAKRQGSVCHLIFLARHWERKGGDVAVAAHTALAKMGVPSRLTTVGCPPPSHVSRNGVTVLPFLDRNRARDSARMNRLYLESHFLISPTRADCSPMVISEANAYGVPAVVTDVGGIPTIMRHGLNGFMLPLAATGADFARVIAEAYRDRCRYEQLARTSREEYEHRLNWGRWSHQVAGVLKKAAKRA